jgi:spore maturation protein SpmA/spore maturation protein SpmB
LALSRIWSAFVIISILTAAYLFFFVPGRNDVFNRMVSGTKDDVFKYYAIGTPTAAFNNNIDSFAKQMADYKYTRVQKITEANLLISDDFNTDAAKQQLAANKSLRQYTYQQMENRKQKPVDGIFAIAQWSVTFCIGLVGIMCLFMGFMSIAEKAGGMNLLSKIIGPFFNKLFPGVPKNHPAHGHMMMNFSANLLGLDNAATPFGIKAMQSLQELNPDKNTATNAQILFLTLHASGLTLIPVGIIASKAANGSASPTDIFLPCVLGTFITTLAVLFMVSFKQKINLLQPIILAWLLGIAAFIGGLGVFINTLSTSQVGLFSEQLGTGVILLIFLLIVLGGLYKKINLFEAFIDGAKNGWETAIKIIPYILCIMAAISLLRTSGTFDLIINGVKQLLTALGASTRWVDALPTALIKPLSGSGARGMMVDTMRTFGPDSFAGRTAAILNGSSDTTFYILAVYYGAVGIKNSKYSLGVMLLADLVALIAGVCLAYFFFGSA